MSVIVPVEPGPSVPTTRAKMSVRQSRHVRQSQHSRIGGDPSLRGRPRQTYILTETYEEVENFYVELGSKKSGFDEQEIPDGIAFEVVTEHINREIRLKVSCQSLPFTLLFYLCVIWSAWLKCDTYNFGVGSSLLDMFGSIEIEQADVDRLFSERTVVPVSGRRLKAAGKGSGGAADEGSGVTSPATLWGLLHQGVVPMLWHEGDGRVRTFHKIIGGLRLRQKRSIDQECQSEKLRSWYSPPSRCRSWSEISTDQYGINRTADAAFSPSVYKDGYFETWLSIEENQTVVQQRLMDLWNGGWIDYKTRSVMIDMGLYNGDVDAFAIAQNNYEFGGDGAVRHIARISVANNQFRMWYYLAADSMVACLIIILSIQECIEVAKSLQNSEFFSKYLYGTEAFWNISDWASMLLGTLTFAGYVWLNGRRDLVVDSLSQVHGDGLGIENYSVTLDVLTELIEFKRHHELLIFLFFLAIMIRFFKAFRGQPRLAVLSATFAKCCQEVMYFFVIFVVVFSNFVVTGFLLFNSQIAEWSTLSKSINECFEILMGEFEFAEMYNVHPFAASLWFWAYMILVLLITLSMLLAVILETYSVVKLELGTEQSEGLVTQIYYLLLQSRIYLYIRGRSGADGWHRIEKVRDSLQALEGAQRLTLIRDRRFMGQHVVFRVTRNTFHAIGVPEAQINFFWGVFKKQLDSDKGERKSVLESKAPTPPPEPEKGPEDLTYIVERLEKRLASNEGAMRSGLRDIFIKLSELDGRSSMIA